CVPRPMGVRGPVVRRGDLNMVAVVKGHDDVEVLVDRRADDRTAVLGVVGLQVGAASGEAEAEGCARDQHDAAPTAERSRQSATAPAKSLTATTSGSKGSESLISAGRHPAARAASTSLRLSPTMLEAFNSMPR